MRNYVLTRRSPSDESTYNESRAIYLAYVTSVSYCHEENIINWSCSPCALVQPLIDIRVVEDTKGNFQGIVGYNKDSNAVIIAFRGSMDITNWIDNMTFLKTKPYSDFPDVAVHQGFYWAYKSVSDQVVPAAKALLQKYPNAELWTTGHSLGAAVAALCAFELHVIEKIDVDTLYTFGEPRVGNSEFSTQLIQAVPHLFRVTHFRDIVPHLPPKWLGFYHSTREIFYDELSQSYQVCNQTEGEDPMCSDVCSPFGCRSKSPGLKLQASIVQDNLPIEVSRGVYVGSIHAAFNLEGLQGRKISHVLNLAGTYATFPDDFVYLSVSIRDKDYSNLLSCLPLAMLFIECGLHAGGVLIHCAGGRSRSPAVAMAYLMIKQNMSFAAACDRMRTCRPVMSLNPGFELQLQCLEKAKGDVFLAHQMLLQAKLLDMAQQHMDGTLEMTVAAQEKKRNNARTGEGSQPQALAAGCDDRGMLHGRTPSGYCLSLPNGPSTAADFIPALRSMGTLFGCKGCGTNLFCSSAIVRHSPDTSISKPVSEPLARKNKPPVRSHSEGEKDSDDGIDAQSFHSGTDAVDTRAQPKESVDPLPAADELKKRKPLLAKLRLRPRSPGVEGVARASVGTPEAKKCEQSSESRSSRGILRGINKDKHHRPREAGDHAGSSDEHRTSERFWRSLTNSLKPSKRASREASESIDREKKEGLKNPKPDGQWPRTHLEGDDPHGQFIRENTALWEQKVRQIQRSNSVEDDHQRFVTQLEALLAEDAKALDAIDCHSWFLEPQTWFMSQVVKSTAGKLLCPSESCRSELGEWQWNGSR
ncbi:TPA: hypothetical protein N0F65_006473 [Lagenidium giganteum]|uniref:Protein-tyrosine-phosphatase n=1 Tax=Lagenidium giganteum TaxID=4803 RepID=A0AAV2YN16_9STRA|nr:TPA: hypothetical protein N0F65_006473 [Lagenidium giganteum]